MIDASAGGSALTPLRMAVVGAGPFGTAHARAVAAADGAVLAGVVDRDVMRAARLRDGLADGGASAITVAEDLADLSERTPGLQAASIVVGGGARVALTLDALRRGLHVLIEKPVALTAADAQRIQRAATQAGRIAMPAHILRFAAPYRAARARIVSGEIGVVTGIELRRLRGTDHHDRFPDIHPVLMTMVHDIDLVLWLARGASTDVEVISAVQAMSPGRAQPDEVHATISADGIVCSLVCSWNLEPGDDVPDRMIVRGTEGEVRVDLAALRDEGLAGVTTDSDWLTPHDGGGALGAEIAAFIAATRGASDPSAPTLADAIAGLSVAERIITTAGEAAP